MRLLRLLAFSLVLAVSSNALAQAAAPAAPPGPYDKFIQKLTARGTGHGIKVTEKDGTEIKGVLVSFDSTGLQVIAPHATAPVHVDYVQVSTIGNAGMSTGAKIGTGILIGVVALAVIIVVALAVIFH